MGPNTVLTTLYALAILNTTAIVTVNSIIGFNTQRHRKFLKIVQDPSATTCRVRNTKPPLEYQKLYKVDFCSPRNHQGQAEVS